MKLIIAHKNGRHRKETSFEIDAMTAHDPVKRAAAISAKSAGIAGRVVNWRIEE